MIKKAIQLYEKGMTQSEVAAKLETTQKVIWRLFKNAGYKCRVAKKRNQFGENNSSWKGDRAGYKALHYRLYKARGRPQKCEVCGCSKRNRRYQWANLTGKLSDLNDYKRMCESCHAKYDKMIKNITK